MADTKVSGLAAVASFLVAQEFPVNDAGTSKKITGTQIRAGVLPQIVFFTGIANPAATTSLVGVMMGMGSTWTITPSHTGNLVALVRGNMGNNTASDYAEIQLAYGTGVAPVNGAAATGTAIGALLRYAGNANTAGVFVPYVSFGYVTGLTLATAYWLDINLKSVIGGTSSINSNDLLLLEF